MIGWFVFNIVCEKSLAVMSFMLVNLFVEPLPLDRYWLAFLMPLIAAICVVYKTIKLEDITQMPKSAGLLAVQIILFMVSAAVFLSLVVRLTSG